MLSVVVAFLHSKTCALEAMEKIQMFETTICMNLDPTMTQMERLMAIQEEILTKYANKNKGLSSEKEFDCQSDELNMKDVFETSICMRFDPGLTQLEKLVAMEQEVMSNYQRKKENKKLDEKSAKKQKKLLRELHRQQTERAGLLQCVFRAFKKN